MKRCKLVILTVIGAIVVVALAVVPAFVRTSRGKKQALTRTMLTTTALAIHSFYKETGRWPESLDALQKNEKGMVYIDWGDYPKQDAWRRKIIYNRFEPLRGFGSVASYGADGKPGGEGLAADLEVRFGVDFPTWEQLQTNAPNQSTPRTTR